MTASRGLRLALLGVLGLGIVVAMVAGAVRLKHVHDYGWEWTVFPSAAPPKIHFEGRDYIRGVEEAAGVPRGWVVSGHTLGDGQIYKARSIRGTSTVVVVKDGRRVYGYGLLGGP